MKNRPFRARLGFAAEGIAPSVKVAKDMLAGAVLSNSIAASIVAAAMAIDTVPHFLAETGLVR